MMKRLIGYLQKDFLYAHRSYCFYIVVALALIFALLINFVIAEDFSIKPEVYYSVSYTGEYSVPIEDAIENMKVNHTNVIGVDSESIVRQRVSEITNSIGLIVHGQSDEPVVEFVIHGYENDEIVNTLIIAMKDEINTALGSKNDIEVKTIGNKANYGKIPANKFLLPLFLVMEPTMLGFMLVASLIYIEKSEGTIKAYAVTPGRLVEYLLSKAIVMVSLGIVGALVMTLLVLGLKVNYLALIGLIGVGAFLATSLGLIMTSFFRNLSESMIWILLVTLLLGVPLISYMVPSFAPIYIRLLPTYRLVFAVKEAVFPTGNTKIIIETFAMLSGVSAILFALALKTFKRNALEN
ncbi:ABC transporter permease [Fusibacter sp. JL216-2]|uniref:ABC transporter permease n=1 Tax=Fusibacter sp. JL216-2 TaxID=3071453 RepID=UPI003D349229